MLRPVAHIELRNEGVAGESQKCRRPTNLASENRGLARDGRGTARTAEFRVPSVLNLEDIHGPRSVRRRKDEAVDRLMYTSSCAVTMSAVSSLTRLGIIEYELEADTTPLDGCREQIRVRSRKGREDDDRPRSRVQVPREPAKNRREVGFAEAKALSFSDRRRRFAPAKRTTGPQRSQQSMVDGRDELLAADDGPRARFARAAAMMRRQTREAVCGTRRHLSSSAGTKRSPASARQQATGQRHDRPPKPAARTGRHRKPAEHGPWDIR